MIEEVKNFDMRVFIAFQRVVHDNPKWLKAQTEMEETYESTE